MADLIGWIGILGGIILAICCAWEVRAQLSSGTWRHPETRRALTEILAAPDDLFSKAAAADTRRVIARLRRKDPELWRFVLETDRSIGKAVAAGRQEEAVRSARVTARLLLVSDRLALPGLVIGLGIILGGIVILIQ